MNIAIYEENVSDFNYIKNLINEYSKTSHIDYIIYHFKSVNEILDSIKKTDFSIFILNIDEKTANGIFIAKKIREFLERPIIFTSLSSEFALRAFELNAIHYLLKPTKYELISSALKRCHYLFDKHTLCLDVKVGHKLIIIPQNDINYIEIWNKVATIYTTDNLLTKTYATLNNIYSKLEHSIFIRPQRSFIVNMNFVSEIQSNRIILNNNMDITISREKRFSIKQKYNTFISRNINKKSNNTFYI